MAYQDEQTQRINDMYNTLKNSKMAELQGQRDSVITDLNRQKTEQLPQYQTARTQADVNRVQEMVRLKEQMASGGAYNSGDNFTRQANINSLRNNSVNQINGNENQFVTGITNKIADTNNSYNTNVNSISQSIEADRLKAIADLQERLRQEQLAREAEDRAYQRQVALQQASQRASAARSSSSTSQKAEQEAIKNGVYSEFYKAIDNRNGEGFLYQNRDAIIANLGAKEYENMMDKAKGYIYSMDENKRYTGKTVNQKPMNYE